MEAIRRYIVNFQGKHKKNTNFDLRMGELLDAMKKIKTENPADILTEMFTFGYAKGYRAALSEMRKEGMKHG